MSYSMFKKLKPLSVLVIIFIVLSINPALSNAGQWKRGSGQAKLLGAPMAGYEGDNVVFIARVKFEGGLHPGKFVDNLGCYVSYGGREYKVNSFEYYMGNLKWVRCYGHNIPRNAVVGGYEATGEPLYIGRAEYNGMLITGKAGYHLSSGICIPYDGVEIQLSEYEVLVE